MYESYEEEERTEKRNGKRSEILHKADEIINGSRQYMHGKPEDSFQTIADFWNIFIEKRKLNADGRFVPLTGADTAEMLAWFKMARAVEGTPIEDYYVDVIGYMAIAASLRD